MAKPNKNLWMVAYTDGGSRGNPGPSGIGVVVKLPPEREDLSISKFVGEKTNNEAEYLALLEALTTAVKLEVWSLQVFSDSEVMVKQVNQEYACAAPKLKPLLKKAQALIVKIPEFAISHIPREKNKEADKLANKAMDKNEAKKS